MQAVEPVPIQVEAARRPNLLLLTYTAAILASASLLFLIEPMFAKLLLPRVGGAPAVWTTAILFFQVVLLAAYAYAHLLSARLRIRTQVAVHCLVLCLPLLVLPIHLVVSWDPPPASSPVPWVLAVLALSVGLPFAALSATAPLLQRWFTGTGHPHALDPYFLYRASNAGSLIALIAYPIVIEPRLGLGLQARLWTIGYIGFGVIVAACGGFLWRTGRDLHGAAPKPSAPAPRIPIRRRLRWLALAAVPALWMLALTAYFTTVILPMPLLWVIPLALYLGTFALAFAPRPWLPRQLLARVLPFLALPLAGTLLLGANGPLIFLAVLHVSCFFVAALLCHTELAADRPVASQLTRFYLWVALGGVAGGGFSALAAPMLFRSYAEYPLAIIAACLLKPSLKAAATAWDRVRDLAFPLGLGLVTLGLAATVLHVAGSSQVLRVVFVFGLPALVCFSFSHRSVRFGLGLLALFAASAVPIPGQQQPLFAGRDFFGVHQVVLSSDQSQRQLIDGGVVHGVQYTDPARRDQLTAYYTKEGPVGDFFGARTEPGRGGNVAVIGLGAGTIACYAQAEEWWTFYEIDPTVGRIATDPALFSFLADCHRDRSRIVLGDGRLEMAKARDHAYGTIVLDAFGSDTVPVHLLTREAFQLYLSKLDAGGALLLNVSNRFTDLRPVISNVAFSLGLVCYGRIDAEVPPAAVRLGRYPSSWVVVSRDAGGLGSLVTNPAWRPVPGRADEPVWTDDYSDVLRSMQLR